MNPIVVGIVVNGLLVTGTTPAILCANVVVAPLDPYVRALATRISWPAERGPLVIERGGTALTLALGSRTVEDGSTRARLPIAPYLRAGTVVIPLAATARALGATVTYDARTRTLAISLPEAPLETLRPGREITPPAPGLPTFAPTSTPAPQPTISGIPKPRRTPIPIGTDG